MRNKVTERLARGERLTVLLADPQAIRRQALARRPGRHRVAEAASLHEAYLLAESLEPEVIALAADFLGQAEAEGILRLAQILGASAFAYADRARPPARTPLRDRLVCIAQTADDGLEDLLARLDDPRAVIGADQAEGGLPELILIGASTGGIAAIEEVLAAFPADCPPTLVVQHMRDGYIARLVQRLDQRCRPRVLEATEGLALQRGMIAFASDEQRHLTVAGRAMPRCALIDSAPCHGHRPAVDPLFQSATPFGPRVAAALLTGMGSDGAAGLGALHRAGAFTIAQDAATSTVWGMPRVAVESGAAEVVLPLPQIGAALLAGRRTGAQPLAGARSW